MTKARVIAKLLAAPAGVLVGFALVSCAGGGKVQLSDVAAAACDGQKAANAAGEVGMLIGQPEVAAAASVASVGLGLACKW